jgi:hypothetical protein
MLTSRMKLRVVSKLIILAVLITVAAFTLFGQKKGSARVCHEVEHYYYSDATYSEQVGYKWLYCDGTYSWGQVTQYDFVVDGECCGWNCGYCFNG